MQVYEPEEDSFLLENEILNENLKNKKCLDLGTGSGIQASAMYKAGSREIVCADINYKALLKSQKRNSEIKQCLRFIESDLFSSLKDEKFDFIAFNPPYVPSEEIKWKDLDGGKKGREIIDKFLTQLLGHLSSTGVCLLLISSLNNEKEIIDFIKSQNLFVNIVSSKKLFFETLFVLRITKIESIGIDEVDF